MKFKSLLISAVSILGAVMMTACDDQADPKYTPAPAEGDADIYMSSDQDGSAVELNDDTPSFNVLVYRADDTNAATYPVKVTGTDLAPFTYPATVDFAAGENTANFPVTANSDLVQGGVDYVLNFSVGSGETTPYFTQAISVTVNYISWVPYVGADGSTMATYTDDIIGGLFGKDPVTYQVPMEYNPAVPGMYRLVSPYGEAFPYNEPGDYSTETSYLYFNATNPNGVFISDKKGQATVNGSMYVYDTGCNWGYGSMGVSGMYNYALQQGASAAQANAYLGVLSHGIMTFPTKGLLVIDDDDMYYGNTNGGFRLVFPGVEDGGGDVVPEWQSIGNAMYYDAWYYPAFGVEGEPYEVPVEINDEGTKYRLVNPYRADVCPDGIDYSGDYYFVFDVTYPETVLVEPQYLGLDDEDWGHIYFQNRAGGLFQYNIEQGATPEVIIPWLEGRGDVDPYTPGSNEIVVASNHVCFSFPECDEPHNDGVVSDYIFSWNLKLEAKIELPSTEAQALKANKTASIANYTGLQKRAFAKVGMKVNNFKTRANRLTNRSIKKNNIKVAKNVKL